MDSFAQQLFDEIDQRCKAYQLSNSSINLNEEFNSTVSIFQHYAKGLIRKMLSLKTLLNNMFVDYNKMILWYV